MDGRIVRCSRDHERGIFDAVRAGLGQCGVILRVGYPLRVAARAITTRCFVYADPERFVRDAQALAAEANGSRWLSAVATRDPLRRGRWLLVLFLGDEHEPDRPPQALPSLGCDRELPRRQTPLWAADGVPAHPFFRRFDSAPAANARPAALNPWVEHVVPAESALAALEDFLRHGPLPRLPGP